MNNRKRTRGRKFNYIPKKGDEHGNRQTTMTYHKNPKSKGKKKEVTEVVQHVSERRTHKVIQPSTYQLSRI